ncbi:unnamed protein product [Kuraishia capsulata CBS 1993]|uniref:Transcriptional coactivator HFI1/ADA1 n=1 Tax=Kuraishia capsulata CBS 1993 TaxID=1382522 RepID=W6MS45_9ASCO|nr:uncharacterized protein KUCA_T00005604001 [Kuraishia capsulata CBS 1993]CDK29611.1 unnamed protein product [Kuraishia capsulata CBS 1993]
MPQTSSVSTPVVNGKAVRHLQKLSNGRIEIENLVNEFQKRLGKNWDGYQIAVSLFLVGKLSRQELVEELDGILDARTIKLHNQLLLANLANSVREGPIDGISTAGFGGSSLGKRRKDSRKNSSQYERLKKDILALPIRERRRIKGITREAGKTGMVNSCITLTRQSMLPKVPIVNNKETGIAGNTIQWAQDVMHGFQTPLATETFEIPDNDSLKARMLWIAREHGLIGQLNDQVVEFLLHALETHLRGLVESVIDVVKYRKLRYAPDIIDEVQNGAPSEPVTTSNHRRVTLTLEDVHDTITQQPYIIEPGGPTLRLENILLENDDLQTEDKTGIAHLLRPIPNRSLDELKLRQPMLSSVANTANGAPDSSNKNELNWLIHDILTE